MPPSLTVAVTGPTGMIGSALVERLRARGHQVRRVLRPSHPLADDDVAWDASSGASPTQAVAGVDAIVHLAGEPIAHRWTAARKRAIRASRVDGTASLARAVAEMEVKPRAFISGSAVGYYGDRADEVLDESSQPGSDYLARVAVEWEGATRPVADAGVRVVLLRTGVVLSTSGGALPKLLPVFRMGAGGAIGSGEQWMSWIALEDHLRAIERALSDETLQGPVNVVAPNPVTNAAFAETLGRVLARPAVVRVPAFALELLYGEMGRATVLASQRALPRALTTAGFEFSQPTLEQALRSELGR
jgi:uncharacterized protein (TIGR01777 family)